MKKLLAILLVFTLAFSFAACGGGTTETSSAGNTPTDDKEAAKIALDAGLKATAELDYEGMEKYYVEPMITKEGMDYLGDAGKIVELFLSKMQGATTKCVENEDGTITATVGLVTIDFNALVNDLTAKMMEKIENIDFENMTAETMAELQQYSFTLIGEALADDNVKTVASMIEVEMEKVDGQWKISDYDTIYKAVLGELEDAMAYMVQ